MNILTCYRFVAFHVAFRRNKACI